jgi:hypothetical protein
MDAKSQETCIDPTIHENPSTKSNEYL